MGADGAYAGNKQKHREPGVLDLLAVVPLSASAIAEHHGRAQLCSSPSPAPEVLKEYARCKSRSLALLPAHAVF